MGSDADGIPVVFSFEERTVRTVEINGSSWFVGRDVCDCLGHKNAGDRLGRLADDERLGVGIPDPHGRVQETVVVSEAGVYQLIFTSRVEAAQRFKRWLAHEVLPAIRRGVAIKALPSTIQPGTREFTDAIQAVRELRLLAGRQAALALWNGFGLPPVPAPGSRRVTGSPAAAATLVREFLVSRTVARSGHCHSEAALWRAFEAWRLDQGESRLDRSAFGVAIREALPTHREVDGEWLFDGVQLFANHYG